MKRSLKTLEMLEISCCQVAKGAKGAKAGDDPGWLRFTRSIHRYLRDVGRHWRRLMITAL